MARLSCRSTRRTSSRSPEGRGKSQSHALLSLDVNYSRARRILGLRVNGYPANSLCVPSQSHPHRTAIRRMRKPSTSASAIRTSPAQLNAGAQRPRSDAKEAGRVRRHMRRAIEKSQGPTRGLGGRCSTALRCALFIKVSRGVSRGFLVGSFTLPPHDLTATRLTRTLRPLYSPSSVRALIRAILWRSASPRGTVSNQSAASTMSSNG